MLDINLFGHHLFFSYDLVLAAVVPFLLAIGNFFVKYIVLKWLATKITNWLEPHVLAWWHSDPIMRAIITHFHARGLGRGHGAANPFICQEDECVVIQPKL